MVEEEPQTSTLANSDSVYKALAAMNMVDDSDADSDFEFDFEDETGIKWHFKLNTLFSN